MKVKIRNLNPYHKSRRVYTWCQSTLEGNGNHYWHFFQPNFRLISNTESLSLASIFYSFYNQLEDVLMVNAWKLGVKDLTNLTNVWASENENNSRPFLCTCQFYCKESNEPKNRKLKENGLESFLLSSAVQSFFSVFGKFQSV